MKPSSQVSGGTYTRTRVTRIKSTGAVSQTSQVFTTTRETSELTGVTSGTGDFKLPLNQAYRATKNSYQNGTRVTGSEDSIATYVLTDIGDLGQGTQSYPFADSSVTYNKCLSELNNKARSALDLSVSVAQAGQVVSAIRRVQDIVHYVRKFPTHALRLAFKDYKNDPKRLGSAWLEFQYGWKPLAQDVYDTVNNVLGGRINLTKIRERAQDSEEKVIVNTSSGVVTTDRVKLSTWVEIGIQLDLNPSVLNRLSDYTSLNPASLAWELTPFSFVVDWVYDVGGYIRSTETALLNSHRFVSGYRTITSRVENFRQSSGGSSSGSNTFNSANTSGTFKSTQKSRTALSDYPFPIRPRFKCDLGSGQLLNAAALLSQRLGR